MIPVAVVLVNWRQPLRTLAAVDLLKRQALKPDVIVVDNGSGDESVQLLSRLSPRVLVISRQTNDGFGAGCNAGIEAALDRGAEHIWLLNNDAEPEESALEELVAVGSADPKYGVVGTRLVDPLKQDPDHAGSVMNAVSLQCNYALSEEELNASTYGWVSAASMLVSAQALRQVGLFDPGYFMYWEDADLCLRMRRNGFNMRVAERAVVRHTAGTSSSNNALQRYKWHIESQLRWVGKHCRPNAHARSLIFARHLLKSLLTLNIARLSLTASLLFRRQAQTEKVP